ncbi:hypothetical protein GCM10009527_006390 [Actinomadura nitritigenes]|nr:hypothetical protein [Actinomadura nitritigenes]
MEMAEVARLIERAAAASGFDDLRDAAGAVAAVPADPQRLYDFGYACIERGVSFLAIPALRTAQAAVPDSAALLGELVSALEDENRHADAVAALEAFPGDLGAWPGRYLLAHNALMAGDLERSEREAARLPEPDDERWRPARDRLRGTLARARAVRAVSPLDHRDLRGWHFALGGSVLLTLSPYGFEQGMTGRYAFVSDSYGDCRRAVDRLRLVLDAAGRRPRAVGLLDDRSSTILGLAVAGVLGLPAERFAPGSPGVLVVAYDLSEAGATGLRERAEGQVLFERATRWTDPPPVSADVSGFLHQTVMPPWGERMMAGEDGEVRRVPEDRRPVEELAAEIMRAAPATDGGDGETPPDTDEGLAALVAAVRAEWLTGPRYGVRSPGPVASSRFM